MMAFDQQLLSRIRNRYAKESPGAGPVRCPDCKPVPATTDAPAKEPPELIANAWCPQCNRLEPAEL